MLHLISRSIPEPNPALPEIAMRVDRQTIYKRRWRGRADDGTEFGVEVSAPLNHGDSVWESETHRYVVQQSPESVVEISLSVAPSAAAGIGWAIGNMHLELSADPTRLLAPDEPAVRQLLARLQVPFTPTTAIFRPGRFARGNQVLSHDLGPSLQH